MQHPTRKWMEKRKKKSKGRRKSRTGMEDIIGNFPVV
jgi:hypothetical protein